ncbi:hypothetical protein JI752_016490 [Lysobacter sp. MMG2]|uniref:DUF6531 domain-containing protein n=1 Tax=Lysobacter sp. MMG2 TaxID=2801338 RepID=UPI001C233499|nr:DUF6531 domain-containing protein [Lysobacter sp. MMG2]MBU8977748.1 hypothetical protein [Lysobacter sp. MMG2]
MLQGSAERVAHAGLSVCKLVACIVLLGLAMPVLAEECDRYEDLCPRAKALQLCQAKRETTHACGTTWGHYTCPATEHVGNDSVPLGHFDACINTDIRAGWVGWVRYYYDYASNTPDVERNRGNPPCEKGCFGDPVNALTGNKFETHTEFVGAGSFPLRAEWTYNASGTSAALTAEDLIFGRNRSHFYGRRVLNGTESGLIVSLVARPDGNTIRFYKGGDAGWSSNGDDPGALAMVTMPDGSSKYRFDDGKGGSEFYGLDGRLLSLRSPQGEEQTLSYDLEGRLERVVDRYGRALVFEYQDGRVSRLHQPDGGITAFSYSPTGDLVEVVYPGGSRTEYRYDESGFSEAAANSGLLTAVIHDGQRYSSTKYDTYGRAASTWLGSGVDRYDFKYSGTTAVPTFFEVKEPGGGTRSGPVRLKQGAAMPDYVYSSYCPGCSSFRTTYKYDKNSYVNTETSSDGTVTDFDYNGRGLLVQKIEAANQAATKRTEQTSWDAVFPVPLERKVLDASGTVVQRTTWTYNDRGQELTSSQHDTVSGAARTATTTYCEQTGVDTGTCPLVGLVLTTDGPRTDVGDLTTYAYYGSDHPDCATAPTTCAWRKGDLWKVTNASGQVTETLRYDGAGRALSIKDANGVITDLDYDARGLLTERRTRGSQ